MASSSSSSSLSSSSTPIKPVSTDSAQIQKNYLSKTRESIEATRPLL